MGFLYRLLVVDDEAGIREVIKKYAVFEGYEVEEAADGMEVIQKLREWTATPILVISARSNEHEKAHALDLGADDYITKPFATVELLARIRTSLRHSSQMQDMSSIHPRPYHHNNLTINFEDHVVTLKGNIIHLTQIEYKLLILLARNSGKVLTYTSIMEKIWGPYTDNNNQILRVNMANVRHKIENNPAAPKSVSDTGW